MKTLDRISEDWVLATEIHKLESRLWRMTREEGSKVVLITSPSRGEGKSTTVAYLASALALHPDRRILAADLDFRDPKLNAHFGVEVHHTLGNVIKGECRLQDAVIKTELPNLDLALPAASGEDPSLLLRTREWSLTIAYFRENYDLVLLDVPALLPVADASVVLPFVDGVILVTMAGRTTKPALRRAREICLGMGVKILGLVVGNLKEALPEYGHGRYYEYYKQKKETAKGRPGGKTPPIITRNLDRPPGFERGS